MNCKPGDLAIIVRIKDGPDGREHIGKIVRCVYVVDKDELVDPIDEPCWDTDPELFSDDGLLFAFRDSELLPIRPDAEPESTETPKELEHS